MGTKVSGEVPDGQPKCEIKEVDSFKSENILFWGHFDLDLLVEPMTEFRLAH